MEMLGTEWGRVMISPAVSANAVEARILNIWARSDAAIVIDDLRFPNDWAMLRRLGGILIRISRPEVSRRRTFADKLARRFSLARTVFSLLGIRTVQDRKSTRLNSSH